MAIDPTFAQGDGQDRLEFAHPTAQAQTLALNRRIEPFAKLAQLLGTQQGAGVYFGIELAGEHTVVIGGIAQLSAAAFAGQGGRLIGTITLEVHPQVEVQRIGLVVVAQLGLVVGRGVLRLDLIRDHLRNRQGVLGVGGLVVALAAQARQIAAQGLNNPHASGLDGVFGRLHHGLRRHPRSGDLGHGEEQNAFGGFGHAAVEKGH